MAIRGKGRSAAKRRFEEDEDEAPRKRGRTGGGRKAKRDPYADEEADQGSLPQLDPGKGRLRVIDTLCKERDTGGGKDYVLRAEVVKSLGKSNPVGSEVKVFVASNSGKGKFSFGGKVVAFVCAVKGAKTHADLKEEHGDEFVWATENNGEEYEGPDGEPIPDNPLEGDEVDFVCSKGGERDDGDFFRNVRFMPAGTLELDGDEEDEDEDEAPRGKKTTKKGKAKRRPEPEDEEEDDLDEEDEEDDLDEEDEDDDPPPRKKAKKRARR